MDKHQNLVLYDWQSAVSPLVIDDEPECIYKATSTKTIVLHVCDPWSRRTGSTYVTVGSPALGL